MSWLLGQTAALLTVMFFIGAALGCLLRRTLAAPQDEAVLSGAGAIAQAGATAKAVARKVDPMPEATRAPSAPPAPATRFERALTTAGTTPSEAPRPVPAAEAPRPATAVSPAANQTAVTPPVIQPRPAIVPGTEPVVTIPPAPVIPAAPIVPAVAAAVAPVAPIATTAAQGLGVPAAASVGAAATIAAAAAATARETLKSFTEKTIVETVVPAAVAAPVATTAAVAPAAPAAGPANAASAAAAAALGQTIVTAPATASTAADDLRRIQGIDGAIAERLKGMGVARFAEIAAWKQPDVQRAGETLGVRGRVERENWVEQAQILAGGGETLYSRRLAGGEVAVPVAPGPGTATGQTGQRTASAVTEVLANKVLGAPVVQAIALAEAPASIGKMGLEAAAAAAAALAAAAKSGGDAARAGSAAAAALIPAAQPIATAVPVVEKIAAAIAQVATPAVTVAPRVEDLAAFANKTTAKPETNAANSPAVAGALPSATPVRPVAQAMRDNLQRLSGVSGELEKMLNGQGVARYSHLANWGKSDIERFDKLLGSDGRISRENWIEQAQILGRGGDTAYSREFDRRAIEAVRGPSETADAGVARPSRLPDAIRSNTGGQPAASTARQDIGGLRSVKSDAYRPTAVDAATAAAAAAAAASGSARVVRSAEVDDLKRIRGVGVLIERKLNSVGIVNYAQIGQWTNTDINKISQMLDFKGRIERENWVEQARILASGGQTEFSRRVDRGEVETSKSKE